MKLRKTKQYIDVNSADAKAMLDYRRLCANMTDLELMTEWSTRVQGLLCEYVKRANELDDVSDYQDLLRYAHLVFKDHPLDDLAGKRVEIVDSEYRYRQSLRIMNNNTIRGQFDYLRDLTIKNVNTALLSVHGQHKQYGVSLD